MTFAVAERGEGQLSEMPSGMASKSISQKRSKDGKMVSSGEGLMATQRIGYVMTSLGPWSPGREEG